MVPRNFDAQYYISNPPVKFKRKIVNEDLSTSGIDCNLRKRKFTEFPESLTSGDDNNLKRRKTAESEIPSNTEFNEPSASSNHSDVEKVEPTEEISNDGEFYELYVRDTSRIRKQFEKIIEIMKSGKKWEGDPDFIENPIFEIRSRHLRRTQLLDSESESDSELHSEERNIIRTEENDLAKTAFLKYRNDNICFSRK